MERVLHTYYRSSSAYRVRIALNLKGLDARHIPIHLTRGGGEQFSAEYRRLNPLALVPVLTEGALQLSQSLAILEYLDERYDAGTKLYPGDAKNRARIRRLIQEMEGYLDKEGIDPITHEYFGKEGAAPDLERVEKAKTRLAEELAYFAKEIRGKYIAGDEPSAADLVLYPWYGYVKRIAFRKPETRLTELVPPAMKAWAERIEAWPFFDKTFPAHWR